MMTLPLALLLAAVLSFLVLASAHRAYWGWVSSAVFILAAWYVYTGPTPLFLTFCVLTAVPVLLFGITALRRAVLSGLLLKFAAKAVPTIGETERIALEAGTVWWEGELFSGHPNWKKLATFTPKPLTAEEQAFLEGPVEEFCKMLDDEDIHRRMDISPEAWAFLKKHKFFGMIIPKAFGGLGYSAAAHSAVVTKIASKSVAAAVTVMVPNSLGPGELLVRYGTREQQEHYLPRLATGEDLPCFALTEPTAGSDAANGRSLGIVTRGRWKGEDVIGISLTFNKRYITLAPVATVVGLAFKLKDPQCLLGTKEDLGITCALLPRDTPGMIIGNRHDPMGVPFMNGPIHGQDVFIPLDYIIGGPARVGQGWRMLMEALAAGRGISLPSLSVGAAQLSLRAASAYASVREQFGMPIGKFEGVRERLARIAGLTYAMNATRTLTIGAVDAGEHPSVATAISKAYLTEGMRLCINDAMDVTAGSSICRGPRNIFARAYSSIPIGITVEGANILTRSLIVFGQGAMRCHPFLHKEVAAMAAKDIPAFDSSFFGHINHAVGNAARAFTLAMGGGIFLATPSHKKMGYAYARLARLSAAFALLTDVALVTLGGSLKRKEYLSGRFADALAWLYIASATLKHHQANGQPAAALPLNHWVMAHACHTIEEALFAILRNLPGPLSLLARVAAFPFGRSYNPPSDALTDKVVDTVLDNIGNLRPHLAGDIHLPGEDVPGLGKLEHAYIKVLEAAPARRKVQHALKTRTLHAEKTFEETLELALHNGILTREEVDRILVAETLREDVIQVNDFDPHTMRGR